MPDATVLIAWSSKGNSSFSRTSHVDVQAATSVYNLNKETQSMSVCKGLVINYGEGGGAT